MAESYCRACYRDLPAEQTLCAACEQAAAVRGPARLIGSIGVLGLPLLIAGMLLPSWHLCLAGGLVSGGAAVAYAVVMLRSA